MKKKKKRILIKNTKYSFFESFFFKDTPVDYLWKRFLK